jgi:hypothetical protein
MAQAEAAKWPEFLTVSNSVKVNGGSNELRVLRGISTDSWTGFGRT